MEINLEEFHMPNPNNQYNLPDNLIFIKEIDQGAFGKVIHVKDKNNKKDFALKIIVKSEVNSYLIDKMKEEIQILKKLHHENIVKYYGNIETINELFIKMEYLKYGTLKDWIKQNKNNISEEEASIIIKKVLSAIDYLHQNQICHRDLKPQNIMFSKENDLNSIKIIDFGLSLQNFDFLLNSDYCGTLTYMAPELIERKSYDLSIDIWSIGIIMFKLLNKGKHPFYNKKEGHEIFLRNIKENKRKEFNTKVSYLAINLMNKLLQHDPIKRYKASEALKHPWITRNPEDKIPETLNEQLNNFHIINNAKKLMMVFIFLKYFKKINGLCKYSIKSKIKVYTRSKSTSYKMINDYINNYQCFSEPNKDKLDELKVGLSYDKKDKEKCEEKNNNNLNPYTNSDLINKIFNSHSSKTNNRYLINHNDTSNTLNSRKSKMYLKVPKLNKDIMDLEPNYLSTQRINKKMIFSEPKKNNILDYKNKKKNINTESKEINKDHFSESKKEKFNLKNSPTKFLTAIKNNQINVKALDYINQNLNKIKPFNLFLNEKNSNNFRIYNRFNLPDIKLGKIINKNTKSIKGKKFINKNSLPNINDNNLNNMKRIKKGKRFVFN